MIFRGWRRRRLRARGMDPEWDRFLLENVSLYRRLGETDRRELQGHMRVFLDEKLFEGCRGARITEEVRLTVASQACMLLLHRKATYYPRFITILVYPGAYIAPHVKRHEGMIVTESSEARAGEAWRYGTVVLSWEDVLVARDGTHPGYNVVLHEFAHELDEEHGVSDTVEATGPKGGPGWARTMKREFEGLRRDIEEGRDTVFSDYGATDVHEFFAVATETFFELPGEVKESHPELYELLKRFYRQDPTG